MELFTLFLLGEEHLLCECERVISSVMSVRKCNSENQHYSTFNTDFGALWFRKKQINAALAGNVYFFFLLEIYGGNI